MNHLWQQIQHRVVLGMTLQAWHTCIYIQVSPEIFNPVQFRALTGPLKDIQRLVPKPLLHYLGCVLRVIVLLEGEPSPQSEVLSALEQVFIKDLSVLFSVHLFLD